MRTRKKTYFLRIKYEHYIEYTHKIIWSNKTMSQLFKQYEIETEKKLKKKQ